MPDSGRERGGGAGGLGVCHARDDRVSTCVYGWMDVWMDVYIVSIYHLFLYFRVCFYTYLRLHVYTYVWMYGCMYAYTYIYLYIYIYQCIRYTRLIHLLPFPPTLEKKKGFFGLYLRQKRKKVIVPSRWSTGI